MLNGLMTDNDLRWRYITNNIDPFRQFIDLCARFLSKSSLSNPECG
jgi:hypothetical protein